VGSFQYYCTCGYQTIGLDHSVVHDDSTHADEDIVVQSAAVYDGAVADGDIVTYVNRGLLVGTMDNRTILNVDFVAYPDEMHVASDHRLKPNTAIIAHHNISDDSRIFGQVAVSTKDWSNPVDRFYQRHTIEFLKD
jgi:hypothetical protein